MNISNISKWMHSTRGERSEEATSRMKLSHDLAVLMRKVYDTFGDAEPLIGT
jgi:hypothetical protein